jgi:hypothetical protein
MAADDQRHYTYYVLTGIHRRMAWQDVLYGGIEGDSCSAVRPGPARCGVENGEARSGPAIPRPLLYPVRRRALTVPYPVTLIWLLLMAATGLSIWAAVDRDRWLPGRDTIVMSWRS